MLSPSLCNMSSPRLNILEKPEVKEFPTFSSNTHTSHWKLSHKKVKHKPNEWTTSTSFHCFLQRPQFRRFSPPFIDVTEHMDKIKSILLCPMWQLVTVLCNEEHRSRSFARRCWNCVQHWNQPGSHYSYSSVRCQMCRSHRHRCMLSWPRL